MGSSDIDRVLTETGDALGTALLTLPEDQWFDRKSGRAAMKDLARPLIAFANSEGGTLAIGLHNGKIDGVSPDMANAVRQAAIDFTEPPVPMIVDERSVGSRRIILVRVQASEHVHTTKSGDCYLRIGDESRRLTPSQQQELLFDRGTRPFESTPVDLAVDDLDQNRLKNYQQLIGSSDIAHALAARDLVDRKGRPTVGAELLFDNRPQLDFPSAYVRVITYNSDNRGTGSRMTLTADERIEGPLPDQIAQAASYIDTQVPQREQLAASGRFEPTPIIPRDAWLEGLVNAVIHRSYSIMGDHIRCEIFPRRIEITSPGRFPGLVDPTRPMEITRFARNPRIARVFSDMGITRELGEGIRRIFDEMRRRGLTEPIYQQGSANVRLTLNSTDAVQREVLARLTPSAKEILGAMRLAERPLGTGEIAELTRVSRPTASRSLKQLEEAGLVERNGSSVTDPRASWQLL